MNMIEAKALSLFSTHKGQQREDEQAKRKQAMTDVIISDDHVMNIIQGVMRTRGDQGATEQELHEVVNTIIHDRYMATCSELAGKGLLDVHFYPDRQVGQRVVYAYRVGLTAEHGKRILCEHQDHKSSKASRGLRSRHGGEELAAVSDTPGPG